MPLELGSLMKVGVKWFTIPWEWCDGLCMETFQTQNICKSKPPISPRNVWRRQREYSGDVDCFILSNFWFASAISNILWKFIEFNITKNLKHTMSGQLKSIESYRMPNKFIWYWFIECEQKVTVSKLRRIIQHKNIHNVSHRYSFLLSFFQRYKRNGQHTLPASVTSPISRNFKCSAVISYVMIFIWITNGR